MEYLNRSSTPLLITLYFSCKVQILALISANVVTIHFRVTSTSSSYFHWSISKWLYQKVTIYSDNLPRPSSSALGDKEKHLGACPALVNGCERENGMDGNIAGARWTMQVSTNRSTGKPWRYQCPLFGAIYFPILPWYCYDTCQ